MKIQEKALTTTEKKTGEYGDSERHPKEGILVEIQSTLNGGTGILAILEAVGHLATTVINNRFSQLYVIFGIGVLNNF